MGLFALGVTGLSAVQRNRGRARFKVGEIKTTTRRMAAFLREPYKQGIENWRLRNSNADWWRAGPPRLNSSSATIKATR